MAINISDLLWAKKNRDSILVVGFSKTSPLELGWVKKAIVNDLKGKIVDKDEVKFRNGSYVYFFKKGSFKELETDKVIYWEW